MGKPNDPNKRHITLRCYVETAVAIEKEFHRAGDKAKSDAYIRALEEATRDVVLTPEDYIKIAEEIKANKEKYHV